MVDALSEPVAALLDEAARARAHVMILTGAGISAESGVPTFRGAEGYWRVGSRNYHPQEMATHEAFVEMPDEVWAWYLYRRSVCRAASPNAAHEALVALERALGDRFLLVTQNVDGLHLRAGQTLARTYQIHGNIDFMRCADECADAIDRVPEAIDREWAKGRAIGDAERALLQCGRCGGRARPHVLWFDETYDEPRYRFESSIRAARATSLLVVVGTSGATNLPMQIGSIVARRGVPILDVNPEENPFTNLARSTPRGAWLAGAAAKTVPAIVERLAASALG